MVRKLDVDQTKQVISIIKRSGKTQADFAALLFRKKILKSRYAQSVGNAIRKDGMTIAWVECFVEYFAQFDEDTCRKLRAFLS